VFLHDQQKVGKGKMAQTAPFIKGNLCQSSVSDGMHRTKLVIRFTLGRQRKFPVQQVPFLKHGIEAEVLF
jgi:hypothetical protein